MKRSCLTYPWINCLVPLGGGNDTHDQEDMCWMNKVEVYEKVLHRINEAYLDKGDMG